VPADGSPVQRARRGLVIGELLVAALLLAVAVSSLVALMYSVSRRPTGARAEAECSASAAATGKCVPALPTAGGPSKLLRPGCATRSVFDQRDCNDSLATGDSSGGAVVVKARTDSAALALLAKKQKAQRASVRPDRGFIR